MREEMFCLYGLIKGLISISVSCSYCGIMYYLLVVYLRERSHVPGTAAWPGPVVDPEFYAETSRGPGPNLLEDLLLLYLVEQGEHRITFSTPFGAVLQLLKLMYQSYLVGRRWRSLPRTWRRSWGYWAPSCSWRDDGSSSLGSWGLPLSAPALDTWRTKKGNVEEKGDNRVWRERGTRRERGQGRWGKKSWF